MLKIRRKVFFNCDKLAKTRGDKIALLLQISRKGFAEAMKNELKSMAMKKEFYSSKSLGVSFFWLPSGYSASRLRV